MNVWTLVLVASVIVLALKVVGYLVPQKLVERPTPARISNLLTIALLAALVATETLASGTHIVFDARVPAIAVAAVLFALRVPFIVVIVAAAVVAALLRMLTGLG